MQTITITFKNGTTLEALSFNKSQRSFQKADREVATFTFNCYQVESFDQLKNIFKSEDYTAEIEVHTVVTDDSEEAQGEVIEDSKVLLEEFVLLSKLVFDESKYTLIPPQPEETDTENSQEVTMPNPRYIPLYTVEIARLSELEKNQRRQTAMVEENMDAIIELAGLIG